MAGKQCVLLLLGIASVVTSAQRHRDVDSGSYQRENNAPQKAPSPGGIPSPGGTKGTPEAKGPSGFQETGEPEGTSTPQASGAAKGQNGTGDSAVQKPDAGQASEKQPPEKEPSNGKVPGLPILGVVVGLGVCVLVAKLLWSPRVGTGNGIRAEELRTLTAPPVIFATHVEGDGADGSRYSGKPAKVEIVLRLEAVLEKGQYTIKREPAVVERRRAR
jgi:hypothetical protein